MKKIIYAESTADGMFEQLLVLPPENIIFEADTENEDGTYYLEYGLEGKSHNTYFIEKIEAESETHITLKHS